MYTLPFAYVNLVYYLQLGDHQYSMQREIRQLVEMVSPWGLHDEGGFTHCTGRHSPPSTRCS